MTHATNAEFHAPHPLLERIAPSLAFNLSTANYHAIEILRDGTLLTSPLRTVKDAILLAIEFRRGGIGLLHPGLIDEAWRAYQRCSKTDENDQYKADIRACDVFRQIADTLNAQYKEASFFAFALANRQLLRNLSVPLNE